MLWETSVIFSHSPYDQLSNSNVFFRKTRVIVCNEWRKTRWLFTWISTYWSIRTLFIIVEKIIQKIPHFHSFQDTAAYFHPPFFEAIYLLSFLFLLYRVMKNWHVMIINTVSPCPSHSAFHIATLLWITREQLMVDVTIWCGCCQWHSHT